MLYRIWHFEQKVCRKKPKSALSKRVLQVVGGAKIKNFFQKK